MLFSTPNQFDCSIGAVGPAYGDGDISVVTEVTPTDVSFTQNEMNWEYFSPLSPSIRKSYALSVYKARRALMTAGLMVKASKPPDIILSLMILCKLFDVVVHIRFWYRVFCR